MSPAISAMSNDDLNEEAKRLYSEFRNDQISESVYLNAIARLVINPLYRYIYSGLGVTNASDQDEVFQKTMVKFAEERNRPDLSDGLSLPWFYTVARRVWIDELRRARPSDSLDEEASVVCETRRSVEERQILTIALEDAFTDLAPKLREVATLSFRRGCTQTQIAEIMELPETTVNYYIGLARKQLTAKLKGFILTRAERSKVGARQE
jgi:RNA polymerase sigma factor (sigma-70 family)